MDLCLFVTVPLLCIMLHYCYTTSLHRNLVFLHDIRLNLEFATDRLHVVPFKNENNEGDMSS